MLRHIFKKQNRPIGIDLFSGAGGLALGFEQAGFDIAAALEFDPIHCATHEFNFPKTKIICRSIAEVSGNDIRRSANLENVEIDVVFGGPPCQGFSMIGKREVGDERNSLVHHFLRVVLELQPKYFVMENVPGMTIGEHALYLKRVIAKFQKSGYSVEENYRILNACNFGVPQSRKRLFLYGAKKGYSLPKYPVPLTRAAGSGEKNGDIWLAEGPTVWDAIGDLPSLENRPELFENDSLKAKFKQPSEYSAYLRGLEKDKNDYSYSREYDRDLLTSSALTLHSKLSQQRFSATPFGENEPISRFHKLNPKGVCNTLRAGTASDRGAFTSPRPIHPHIPRCITVREAARIHSYPDWFRFHKTKWHGFRQVGNSVPPLLARAVAAEVVKALGTKPVKPGQKIALGEENLLSMDMSEAEEHYGLLKPAIEQRRRHAEAKSA